MPKITLYSFLLSCSLVFLISTSSIQATDYNHFSNNTFEPSFKVFDFNVSPNPAKEYIVVKFTQNVNGTLLIHDGLGNQVMEQEVNNEKNKNISLQNLNSGIYFISVKTNAKTVIKRLIKY